MPTSELTRVQPFVIEKAHFSTRPSDWLVSKSEEMVLLGREAGKAVFGHVEQRMERLPAFSVLPIDLRNVRFLDVSFADELVVRLCRRLSAGEFEGRFFLLTRVNPELAENLQVYLEDRKQACLCEVEGSSATILGEISQELHETYAYAVVSRGGRLIQVPPGRDGLKLAAGDEVHVGRAVVVVEITAAS